MASTSSFINRRTRNSFLTSMVVISFVLVLMGVFVLWALYSRLEYKKSLSSIEMLIVIPGSISPTAEKTLEADLKKMPWNAGMRYINKEEAMKDFIPQVGPGFLELTEGINPLPETWNVKLNAAYLNKDSIEKIRTQLDRPEVEKVDFPIDRVEEFKKNVTRYTRIALISGTVVFFICFFIIYSTIRLAIYSKRLVIRSMQLIGATGSFVRRPFVMMGILQGFAAGVLADIGLSAPVFLLDGKSIGFENLQEFSLSAEFLILLGGIPIFGAVLGWFSSRLAVARFLNRSLDELM